MLASDVTVQSISTPSRAAEILSKNSCEYWQYKPEVAAEEEPLVEDDWLLPLLADWLDELC